MKNVVKKITLIAIIAMLTYNVRAEENDMSVLLKSCFSSMAQQQCQTYSI